MAASPRALMRIPDGMSWAEAAAIPNVFVTAHDALVTNAAVAPGESVMVTAGPSGVGTAAIQIARHLGANPVLATTRTPAKAAALRALGAHEVVDTREAGWVEAVLKATGGRGVDVIIDHVGGPMLAGNIEVLALKGRLVSVGRNAGRVGDCDLDEVARKRAQHHRRHLPHAHAGGIAPVQRAVRRPSARRGRQGRSSSPCSTAPSRSSGCPTPTSTC